MTGADAHGSPAIRPRAIVIGLAALLLSARWIFYGEIVRYSFVTLAAPFCHAVYILLVLTVLNMLVGGRFPRLRLTSFELLTIYAMVSIGSAIMSCDMQSILIGQMPYPAYFIDSPGKWKDLVDGAIPSSLIVTDRDAVTGFYRGNATFWAPEVLRAWATPILIWTVVLWMLALTMQAMCALLLTAWAENERLTFPVVALPIALATEPRALFANRLLWVGFAIAGGITLLNGLNYLYPSVPALPIKRQTIVPIDSGPLSGPTTFVFSLYFFAIALGFLMPLDLGLSLWIFFLLHRAQLAFVAVHGYPPESRLPYADSQAFGAYMAVFAATAWRLRSHVTHLWSIAWRPEGHGDPERPAHRRNIAVAALGSAAIVGFLLWAGMSPVVAVAFPAIFFAVAIMITRIRAEFGFPVHDMHSMGPGPVLVRVFGAETFSRSTLGMFSMLHWMHRAYRGHVMPHQLEAYKLAGTDLRRRSAMSRAMTLAVLAAVPICFAVFLSGYYDVGAATGHVNMWGVGYGREAFGYNLPTWLKNPARADIGDGIATGAGFAVALLLAFVRTFLPGVPLHPLAYAVSNSWGMAQLWLPIMIGSLCKGAVLKGRGLKGYRGALQFFFGLMLGEFAVGCSWTLVGMALQAPTYEFWP